MTNTRLNSLQLSSQEIRALVASFLHIKGGRCGPKRLLVEIQAGDPNSYQPLFCFGGFDCNNFSRYLNSKQPVYRFPWLIKEVSDPTTFVYSLAALCLDEIRSLQPQGPYQLLGYCFGGWVAFEIAQLLRQQGQEVASLILIERNQSDQITFRYRRYKQITHQALIHWHRLGSLKLAQKPAYTSQLIKQVWQKIIAKFKRSLASYQPQNISIIQQEAKIFAKNSPEQDYKREAFQKIGIASTSYVPKSYSGKVMLIFASESEHKPFWLPQAGWRKLLTGEVETLIVPGGHLSLFTEPHVPVLAEKLSAYLEVD